MPLNASELHARLRISPKSLLAAIMVAGFFITLPIWLASTPEQKQQLRHTTATSQGVEGMLDLLPEEQAQLREMLKSADIDGQSEVQTEKLAGLNAAIRPYVTDESTAATMARWVYVYAERFELPPELILGVISVESRFDHFAVSHVGAHGLMQVMPFWKKELGSEQDSLFDIETNIRYGTAILRIYLDRYGKISRALGAYNGSLGRSKYPRKVFKHMEQFKAAGQDLAT